MKLFTIYLQKAHENLEIAELAFEREAYNACTNRAYYAAYHAAIAILLKSGFNPKIDHKVVQAMFSGELVNRRKLFPARLKRYLSEMQTKRNIADYEPLFVTKKDAAIQHQQAQEFIMVITKEIQP